MRFLALIPWLIVSTILAYQLAKVTETPLDDDDYFNIGILSLVIPLGLFVLAIRHGELRRKREDEAKEWLNKEMPK